MPVPVTTGSTLVVPAGSPGFQAGPIMCSLTVTSAWAESACGVAGIEVIPNNVPRPGFLSGAPNVDASTVMIAGAPAAKAGNEGSGGAETDSAGQPPAAPPAPPPPAMA